MMQRQNWKLAALVGIGALGALGAATRAAGSDSVFTGHPAAATLEKVFGEAGEIMRASTNVSRRDYLALMGADVDYFRKFQREDGAILDPYAHMEVQYATPAFALTAATLVKEAGRGDLLDPATRAMSCALTALVTHKVPDNHSDFFIPLIVHTFEVLKERSPKEVVGKWEGQLRGIVPEKTYRMEMRGMNWNIVSLSGELQRRKDGLVAPEQMDAQWRYLEESLKGHMKDLTPLGLVEDPGAPMAYDAFSRMWLEEMIADGAYTGALATKLDESLRNGALSALLLMSPSGEWANGGRSALHNWNEAENLLIFEIEANRWKKAGNAEVAGSFKRAAHLAFESMRRWQRPSGELWIIKNRAEPEKRLGFESYSAHSQYNLLPMAMLSMAFEHADDSITERATPSECGGYVFDAREHFHKIAAAAGGYYLLIDTGADPHYNGTGLQRVHRAGVGFSALSDSAAGGRAYSPSKGDKVAMTPGLTWRDSNNADAEWHSLAEFSGKSGTLTIQSAELRVVTSEKDHVAFEVTYAFAGGGQDGRKVIERFTLTQKGVECDTSLTGPVPSGGVKVVFPVLVSDGAADLPVKCEGRSVAVNDHGSITTFEIDEGFGNGKWEITGPRVATHSGYVQEASMPLSAPEVRYRITLSSQ